MTGERPDPSGEDPLRGLLERWYAAVDAGERPDPDLLAGTDPALAARFYEVVRRCEDVIESGSGNARPAAAAPELAAALGDNEILEPIGRGASGQVFLARDRALGRLVALKALDRRLLDPIACARFRREAEILATLDHPNIVPIYAVGENEAWLWFSMKRLDGPHLGALERRLAPREAAAIGAAVARALGEAHAHGLIHRDVKPQNIMLDGGAPRLLDFGLAKVFGDDRLTQSAAVPGTLPYMSPEQIDGQRPLDPRTDVYSLGATLYELVAGGPPFRVAGGALPLMRAILLEDAPRLRLAGRDRDFATILARALEKDRARRFQSAADLAEELERYAEGRAILSRESTLFERAMRLARRHRPAFATALLGLAGAATFAAVQLERDRRVERTLAVELERIDGALADRRLLVAAGRLDGVEHLAVGDQRVTQRRQRLAALEALDEILDSLNDFSVLRDRNRLSQLAAELAAAPEGSLPSPEAELGLALALWRLDDVVGARRVLDRALALGAAGAGRPIAALGWLLGGAPAGALVLPEPDARASPAAQADEHVLAALVLRLAGDPEASQWIEVERAEALAPGAYRVRRAKARLLEDGDEHARAIEVLLGLLSEGRSGAVLQCAVARAHLANGDVAAARAWLAKVPESEPLPLRAALELRLALLGDRAQARTVADAARARFPEDADIVGLEGQLRQSEGDLEGAREQLERAVALAQTKRQRERMRVLALEAELLCAMQGGVAADRTRVERAVAALQDLLLASERRDQQARVHYLLAHAARALADDTRAMQHLARAVALDPDRLPAVRSFALPAFLRASAWFGGEAPFPVAADVQAAAFPAWQAVEACLARKQNDGSKLFADLLVMGVVLAATLPAREPLERAVARLRESAPADDAERDALVARLLEQHP